MRNGLLKSFALFALLATVFVGCKYKVQVTATEGGTVKGQNGKYKKGDTVVFRAVPADGYYFNKWSDGNYYNPRKIAIDTSNVTISAEFVDATLPLVDLGLSSGTLWATCNLGAENPWDYGNYYAWGETETKDVYSWETYKYCKGSYKTLTKYCYKPIFSSIDEHGRFITEYGFNGYTDALKTLLPEDDAATTVLGSDYSIPTVDDWYELGSQCHWVWTANYNNQGVYGYIVYKAKAEDDKGTIDVELYYGTPSAFYSMKDAHIFLPAAGFRTDSMPAYHGRFGYYWSASLFDEYNTREAYLCLFTDVSLFLSSHHNRCYGYSVRPVQRK